MEEFELTAEPWPTRKRPPLPGPPLPPQKRTPLPEPPGPNDDVWVLTHQEEMAGWLGELIESALGDLWAKFPVLSVDMLKDIFLHAGISVDIALDQLTDDDELDDEE